MIKYVCSDVDGSDNIGSSCRRLGIVAVGGFISKVVRYFNETKVPDILLVYRAQL